MESETDKNTVLPTITEITPNLEDDLDEIEGHFYTYCKIIILNVIEPVLLALCERPLDRPQHLTQAKALDFSEKGVMDTNRLKNSVSGPKTCEFPVEDLVDELKGLKNDLKAVLTVQERLVTQNTANLKPGEARGVSGKVIASLKEIHQTVGKIKNGPLEEEPLCKRLLTDLSSSFQEIDAFFQKLESCKVRNNGSRDSLMCYLKNFGGQSGNGIVVNEKNFANWSSSFEQNCVQDNLEESSQCNDSQTRKRVAFDGVKFEIPPEIPLENPKASTTEHMQIQLQTSVSSLFDTGCISSEDESSSGSSTQSNETSRSSSSSELDVESHDDAFESHRTQPAKPEVAREAGSNILKRVNSKYLREAQNILHSSLCGQSADCKCVKRISKCSQAELELAKFAHKSDLDGVVDTLLAGMFKDVEIEDIFETTSSHHLTNASKENFANHCLSQTVSGETNSSPNEPCINSKSPSNLVVVLSGTSHDGTAGTLPENMKISRTTNRHHEIKFQGLKLGKYDHILKMIKMLRSILGSLNAEGQSVLTKILEDDQNILPHEYSEGHLEEIGSFPTDSGTMMDLLLEELFKRIILKKFEQKLKNETEVLSDESFNLLLNDLNESTNTTPASFSDDAFEEFRSPSVTNNTLLSSNDQKIPEEPEVKISGTHVTEEEVVSLSSPKLRPKIEVETEEPLTAIPGTSGFCGVPKISELSDTNKNEIRRDRVCEQRISDICLRLKAKKSSYSDTTKNLGVKKFGSSLERLFESTQKKTTSLPQKSAELSDTELRSEIESGHTSTDLPDTKNEKQEPEIRITGTEKTEIAQPETYCTRNTETTQPSIHSAGTENVGITQPGTGNSVTETTITQPEIDKVGSVNTEVAQLPISAQNDEEEIDYNESMKSLGQQITDIEKYLTDFESEERLKLVANEVEKLEERSSIKSVENTSCKLKAPGRHSLLSEDVLEETSHESPSSSKDRLLKVIRMSNESVDSVRISYQNLPSKSGLLSLIGSSDFSTESEDFDQNTFATVDNFIPGVERNAVCCANVLTPKPSPSSEPKHPAAPECFRAESKFRFADGTPKISCSESAQHLVFTKSKLSKLIQEEANALAIDVPSIVKALKNRKSKDFKVTVSQTSDVDVEFSKSDLKLFAVKSKLVTTTAGENAGKTNSAEMLVHKPCLKSSKVCSFSAKNGTSQSFKVSQDTTDKSKFLKTLCSIVSKIKVKPTESEKITDCVVSLSEDSTGSIDMLTPEKFNNSTEKILLKTENQQSQGSKHVAENLTGANFSEKMSLGLSSSVDKIRNSAKPVKLSEVNNTETRPPNLIAFEKDQNQGGNVTAINPENVTFSTGEEQCKAKKLKTNCANGAHTVKSETLKKSSCKKEKDKSQVEPFKPPHESFKNVLLTSSVSNFSDSSQTSGSPSETSINDQLISASSSLLHADETTTSVLALEPTDNTRTSTTSRKSVKEKAPLKDRLEPTLTPPEAPKNRERTLRSAFDLINSCEKILNCKRRSDELRCHSFNQGRNSLVTVLKNVDDRFVDKTSSYGPASLCKNIASQTSDNDAMCNGESSEVEERSTRYDQPESREVSKHQDLSLRPEKSDVGEHITRSGQPDLRETLSIEDLSLRPFPWFGTLKTTVELISTAEEFHNIEFSPNVKSATRVSLHSNDTSFHTAYSEIFYDVPTVESDLAYHLEIERNFNLSCAEIEHRSIKTCARVAQIDKVKSKLSVYEETDKVRGNLGSSSTEKEPVECTGETSTKNGMLAKKLEKDGADSHRVPKTHEKKDSGRGKKDEKQGAISQQGRKQKSDSVKRCDTFVKREFSGRQTKVSHETNVRNENGTSKDSDFHSSKRNSLSREPPRCQRENCRIKHPRYDDVTARQECRKKQDPVTKSPQKTDRARENSKGQSPVQRQTSFEKQLNELHDSLKTRSKIHKDAKCPPKIDKDRHEPKCLRPLCTKSRRNDDIICRSRFTGRRGEEADFLSLESSAESEISRRTFRSDGEKFVAANSDFVMEFFERVYGVYDHIRQCASCKALMSQIIEEVITDLTTMRRKT